MAKKFFKLSFDPCEPRATEWFWISALRDGLRDMEAGLQDMGYRRCKPVVFDRQMGQGKKIYKIESLEDFYWGA